MSRHRSFRRAILATACGIGFLCLASAAEASTIWVRDDPALSGVFGPKGSQTLTIKVNNADKSVAAGTFGLQHGPTATGPFTSFLTYCLEPNELLGLPQTGNAAASGTWTTLSASPYLPRAADIARLYNLAFADSLTTSAKGAAFQVALWEIAFETTTSYNLDAGAFQLVTTNGVKSQAIAYLSSLATAPSSPGPTVILRVGNQDLLFVPVPEPATLGLLGAGLVGLGLATRRRRKTA